MRTRAGIILQARFGSSRLPGKALATIGGRSIVEHCLRRLMFAGVAPVVLATTERPEDDALVDVARSIGAGVYRGATDDVLGRFVGAAAAFGFDVVVRATGDNPATDIQAPGRLLAALRSARADYAHEEGLPYGAAAEAVTREALDRAAGEARQAADREHVTTYVRRNPHLFRVLPLPAPAPLRRPDVRLTVDTAEDLEHVRALFARTGVEMPSVRQLIEASGSVGQSPSRGVQGPPSREARADHHGPGTAGRPRQREVA
jgi:spore coat polysaccharide biosynthesis protein SpsF (cytidylyltransferase family)